MEDRALPALGTEWDSQPRARKAAALSRAHDGAYGKGEFIGQEGFTTASEILRLARAAGLNREALGLDLCCGLGNPALYLVRETGCRLVGVDRSPEAIRLARREAAVRRLAERATFLVATAERLPLAVEFDVVLLIETMLAIADRGTLLREIRPRLRPGGRFAFTVEEGQPLTPEERRRMPDGEAIWLVAEASLLEILDAAGFAVRQVEDHTAAHGGVARRLANAFKRHGEAIASAVGEVQHSRIVAAHEQWAEWLANGRVRKLAIVVERLR